MSCLETKIFSASKKLLPRPEPTKTTKTSYQHQPTPTNTMTHKYNFENATEKRSADKEIGYISIPECDGQVKHPEHLQQHEMLQVLQRFALNGNVEKCKEMIAELPEHQRADTINMLEGAVAEHGRTIKLT